jgi:hypothetical protein
MKLLFNYRIDLFRLLPKLQNPAKCPGSTATAAASSRKTKRAKTQSRASEAESCPYQSSPGIIQLIYEAERLNPAIPVLLRKCAKDGETPNGAKVSSGEWLVAIVAATNFDGFDQPYRFSLYPYVNGHPERDPAKYLMFGGVRKTRPPEYPMENERACWGQEKAALLVLEQCVKAAGRLRGLRPVAGEGGELKTVLSVALGLPARFVEVS